MKDLAARGTTSGYPLDGGRRRVTIYDIAQTCGVSAMTVSRVINGRSDVARSTRVAVEAAIDRLGYRPNAVARSLVEGRSRLIGVVAAGVWEAGIGKTLAVISAEAQSSGYGLLLRTVPTGRPRDLAREIDYLTQHGVAEIIVLGPDPAAGSGTGIGQAPPGTPPLVTLNYASSDLDSGIQSDNRSGTHVATEVHFSPLLHHASHAMAWPVGRVRAARRDWPAQPPPSGTEASE